MNAKLGGISVCKVYRTASKGIFSLHFGRGSYVVGCNANGAFKQSRKLSYLQTQHDKETSYNTNTCNNVMPKSHFFEASLAGQLESMFRACSDASVVQQVRQIHAQVIVAGMSDSNTLGSRILGLYVLCGSNKDAGNLFYRLDLRYSRPWNWIIRGFSMLGLFDVALMFFFRMLGSKVAPDKYTFPYVIKACGSLNSVPLCKMVHDIDESMRLHKDLFIGSSLIKLYTDNGYIHDARQLFDERELTKIQRWWAAVFAQALVATIRTKSHCGLSQTFPRKMHPGHLCCCYHHHLHDSLA